MKEKGQYDTVAQSRLLEFMNNQEFVEIMLEEKRWNELTDTLDELTTSDAPKVKDQSLQMLTRICAIRTQEIDSLKKRLSALEAGHVSNSSINPDQTAMKRDIETLKSNFLSFLKADTNKGTSGDSTVN